MASRFRPFSITIILTVMTSMTVLAASPRLIVLDPSYSHDKFGTQPKDIIREFRAFTVSFDSNDDDSGDWDSDIYGIPEWVAYEIKRLDGECVPTHKRPKWFSEN